MLVLIIPFGAWFTICSQQISQNLMNKQIAKKDMENICMANIYIYTQYVISPGTPAKKPIQKNKAYRFSPTSTSPAPKKPWGNFGGIFFSIKLLRGFIVGIGNSSTSSSTTISTLLVHPMALCQVGSGIFELPFRVEIFSKPKEPSNRRKMQSG